LQHTKWAYKSIISRFTNWIQSLNLFTTWIKGLHSVKPNRDFQFVFLFGKIIDLKAMKVYFPSLMLPCIKFCPNEDELIYYYLHPKVIGEPLSLGGVEVVHVPEFDVFRVKEPDKIWDMIWGEDSAPDRVYFFTTASAAQSLLETCWRYEASEVIYDENTGYPIAIKRQFYYENHDSPQDGYWIMNEYSLDVEGSMLLLPSSSHVACELCKNNLDEIDQNETTAFFDEYQCKTTTYFDEYQNEIAISFDEDQNETTTYFNEYQNEATVSFDEDQNKTNSKKKKLPVQLQQCHPRKKQNCN
ncbi:protein sombrero, partial [Quercus suber]